MLSKNSVAPPEQAQDNDSTAAAIDFHLASIFAAANRGEKFSTPDEIMGSSGAYQTLKGYSTVDDSQVLMRLKKFDISQLPESVNRALIGEIIIRHQGHTDLSGYRLYFHRTSGEYVLERLHQKRPPAERSRIAARIALGFSNLIEAPEVVAGDERSHVIEYIKNFDTDRTTA